MPYLSFFLQGPRVRSQWAAEPLLFSLCVGITGLVKAQESKCGWHKVLFVSAEGKQKAANYS